MNIRLERQLGIDFPWCKEMNLFNGDRKNHTVDFQCDDGWYGLIWDMLYDIEEEFKKNNVCLHTLHILQIKEKHGELCLHLSSYPGNTIKIIDDYGKKSKKVCEYCGKDGSVKRSAKDKTLKALCDNCARELKFKPLRTNKREK